MTPERWRQVEEIFHAALTRRGSDRAAFLASACGGDAGLRREVESLLAQHASNDGVLDGQAVVAAAQIVSDIGASMLTGRRLGPYQLHDRIGIGGMGEVYRARDTKLGRDVAIKILPHHFTNHPDRLARFEREARVLASLNHPHIGAIYGLEDADGVRALVLELVNGDTLADRIARGPLPLKEVLTLARQIAEALEAAHEKGIVHRDLKPENIKITPDGVVKVLDFGLAKAAFGDAAPADLTQSPTLTVGGTKEGVILGTAAYMSPEQASGRTADKRADVWAFGVVLYEMLTRRRAFEGETTSVVIAKVIEREPDWTALPASTPPRLRELVRRCMRKDPKTRLQAIGDARVQIDELISGATEDTAAVVVTQPRAQRAARLAWIAAALSLVIAAALAIPATWYFRRAAPEPFVTRFEIPTPPTSDSVSFALSADGRQLAFVATSDGASRLWVRPLDQVTARPLAGTEGARYPFWKPDGLAIGFFTDGKLKRIDLGSGDLQDVADAPNGRGGTWNSDDVIVFAPSGAGVLMRVMATTRGTPVPVTRLPAGIGSHRFPQFLPDGRHFLFFGGTGRGEGQHVYVGTLDGGESKRVFEAKSVAMYAPPGSLLWVDEGVLVAQPFDPVTAVVSGEPIPVVQDVGLDEGVYRGTFAVSATGVLAHRAGRGERRQLTWVDRAGVALGTVGSPDEAGLSGVELAPNGRSVAVTRTLRGETDVWLIDIGREVTTRFTFHRGLDSSPVWSSDGTRVVFTSQRNGPPDLFEKAASAAGDDGLLLTSAEPKRALSWSSDGQWLLYSNRHPKTGLDLLAAPMANPSKPSPVILTPFDETAGQFSPDGRWVAFQSNKSGTVQIHVQPFRGPGAGWQVTTAGGSQPRWRPDGKELFYVAADNRLMAVPTLVGPYRQTLELGAPVPLFLTRLASGPGINSAGDGAGAQYAVASDGRFLMNMAVEESLPITVVLNWDAALKK
jgi:Tol biopolymer transport system component